MCGNVFAWSFLVQNDRGYPQHAPAQELPENAVFRILLVKDGPTRYPAASVPVLG